MKKYHSYKDSEVGWIGEIPNTWKVSRVKKYFNERNEKVSDLDFPPLSVTKRGILPQLDNVSKSDNHNDRKRVCKNDFVINSRSDRKGSSGMSLLDGSVSLINIVLEPKSILPKYSQYIFKSKDFIEEFFRNGKGIHWDLWSTRFSELQDIKIPIPPFSEQQQIVSFLDTKTSLIDSLIEKTQLKIELLKEKRTSLINEIVTKGLNPNVEMKDSGVEWIGMIPISWELTKMKFEVEIFGRIGFRGYTTEDIVNEGEGVITISPSNIKNDVFNLENRTYLSWEKYHESPEIKIFKDDIILVKTGSTIGKTSIIPDGVPEMTINPQLVVLKNVKLFPKFLYYQTTCKFIKESFDIEQTGSTTPTISQEKVNDFPLVKPPMSEQQQIVEYLDEQILKIDKIISIEEKRIELLKEYHQSLISEVVTGKRKVVE